jgi:hypothetical protein
MLYSPLMLRLGSRRPAVLLMLVLSLLLRLDLIRSHVLLRDPYAGESGMRPSRLLRLLDLRLGLDGADLASGRAGRLDHLPAGYL